MAKEKPKYYYFYPTDAKGRRYTTKEFKEFIPPELRKEILIIDEENKQEEIKVKPKKK